MLNTSMLCLTSRAKLSNARNFHTINVFVCTQVVTNALLVNPGPLHPVHVQAIQLAKFWEGQYPALVIKWEKIYGMVSLRLPLPQLKP